MDHSPLTRLKMERERAEAPTPKKTSFIKKILSSKIFSILKAVVSAIVVLQVLMIFFMGKASYNNVSFQRKPLNANMKILFLGDSTAVGTGTKDGSDSVAGWFAKDFPNAQIDNYSRNGLKIKDLLREFHPDFNQHYQLAVVQIGANDILKFTDFKNVDQDVSELMGRVKLLADHVVFLHSGNVGAAPIFIWPLSEIYAGRSRAMREIYIKNAKEKDVLYVNLYQDRREDLFLQDVDKYYSPDHLHPNGNGYKWWYDNIRKTLNEAQIKL